MVVCWHFLHYTAKNWRRERLLENETGKLLRQKYPRTSPLLSSCIEQTLIIMVPILGCPDRNYCTKDILLALSYSLHQQQQPRHNFTFYFVCAIDSIRCNCCRLPPRLVLCLGHSKRPSALRGEMVKYVIAASSRALFARRTGFGGHHHDH